MFISFVMKYWRVILLAALVAIAGYYKMRYEAIKSDLEAYVLTAQVLYDDAIKENERIKNESEKEINSIMANHQAKLKELNLDRVRETNKLKGSINEISDNLNIAYSAISLRNESASNSTMSKIPKTSSGLAEACGNVYQSLITVTEACQITDLDYKALYNAWDRNCLIYGCE